MPLLGGGSGSAHEVKDYPLASLDADDVQHVLYPVNVEESASPPNCSELQGQELQLIGLPSILALSRLFGVSKAFNLAGKLDVFTLISQHEGGAMTAQQISAALGLASSPGSRGTHDWLDLLVSVGALERSPASSAQCSPPPENSSAHQPTQQDQQQQQQQSLSDGMQAPPQAGVAVAYKYNEQVYRCSALASRYLVRNSPDYMGGLLALNNDRSYVMFEYLEQALRTGQVPEECFARLPDIHTTFGGRQDGAAEFFARAMTGASKANCEALAQHATLLDWTKHKSWADMGGSQGALCCAIAVAHPHMACTTYDLPAVHLEAQRYVDQLGLNGRVKVADHDFFSDAPFPPGHDVFSMGMVLHDWGMDRKQQLIRKAYEALPPGGALVAVDNCIDDGRCGRPLALAFSLTMLMEFGKENSFDYSAQEFACWASAAGFSAVRCAHLHGSTYACVAVK